MGLPSNRGKYWNLDRERGEGQEKQGSLERDLRLEE
jgi:hypothetical protein